jgi:hypothetical protein
MIVPSGRNPQPRGVNSLPLLAPVFLVFEIWQLVMSERYLGIKHIARGGDPREMGPSEPVAFLWTSGIALYALWALALMLNPINRIEALGIIATTAVAYPIRRNCGLKWILIVLTFEGAIRIVFVFSLVISAWRRL